jgi:acyl carrier protein
MIADIDQLVRRLLSDIAPDIDFDTMDPTMDIRDAADIDSVDYLNFIEAVHAATGIDIPERDYVHVRTIGGCRTYLERRLAP